MSALHANVEYQTWQAVSVSKLHLPICFWHNAINHLETFYFNACLLVGNGGFCIQLRAISYLQQNVHFIWNLEIALWDILWNETHFCDAMQLLLKPILILTCMLFYVIILLNWISNALDFEQLGNSFSDDQRRYKHDRKRKLHYKMSPWSCQNNFGCIIVLANNPTATYFCWHSTKCERYLPQFALKYSHRHKDLIG